MSSELRVLGCGRPVSWLVPLVAEYPDPGSTDDAHLESCSHCRAELGELRERWAAVRAAATVPVRVPPDLVGAVLTSVRAVRHGLAARRLELATPGGVTRIGEPALLRWARRLVRDAAATVPHCRVRGVAGDVERLRVRVAVRYGQRAPDVAARLRAECERGLDQVFGSVAPAVDVVVDDVLVPVGIGGGGHLASPLE